ncbi:hypothetical protein LB503_000043 [Fusarium chuoi]|nr:hypothetical protein LB503_000043 [Fusarium chuoi]
MSNVEITKLQALRSLDTVIFVLGQAIDSCCINKDASGIPKAFCVLESYLLVIKQVFGSAHSALESRKDETEQMRDLYPVIKHVADEGCSQLRSIESLFDAVAQEGDRLERYASAVKNGDGKRVETIMVELLTNTVLVAVEPMVSQEQIDALKGALEDAKRLPPSLEEDSKTGVVLNNSGSGNQFYHGGRGNQNHCSGGFQVNGNNENARYTYAEKPKENEE